MDTKSFVLSFCVKRNKRAKYVVQVRSLDLLSIAEIVCRVTPIKRANSSWFRPSLIRSIERFSAITFVYSFRSKPFRVSVLHILVSSSCTHDSSCFQIYGTSCKTICQYVYPAFRGDTGVVDSAHLARLPLKSVHSAAWKYAVWSEGAGIDLIRVGAKRQSYLQVRS